MENKLFLSIKQLFADCPYLMDRLFNTQVEELKESPSIIKENMRILSSGEKVLVKAALDIWNGSGDAKLSEILQKLSPNNIQNFQLAISKLTLR